MKEALKNEWLAFAMTVYYVSIYTTKVLILFGYSLKVYLFALIILSQKIIEKYFLAQSAKLLINHCQRSLRKPEFELSWMKLDWGVHLTLPPHIISVHINSRSMLNHGSVGASLKQNKRNLKKPNVNP